MLLPILKNLIHYQHKCLSHFLPHLYHLKTSKQIHSFMAKAPIRVFSLVVLWLMVLGGVVWGQDVNFSSAAAAAAAPQGQVGGGGRRAEMVPAMFVFGDSLIDNGNNNKIPSFAKANYFPL
ncbi:hypothetical protein GBA52_000462 [Prunus armeniaca]|nr:hypothetical protein GBA52_000462 [Prunus armeniaca]